MGHIRVGPRIFVLFNIVLLITDFSRLLLYSYVNQSPVPPVRSTHPSVYPVLDTTSTNNPNPFDDNDDNESSLIDVSTNNR